MLSAVDSFLQPAGRNLLFRKPSCNLQQTFLHSGKLAAICAKLSTLSETLPQPARDFPERGTTFLQGAARFPTILA